MRAQLLSQGHAGTMYTNGGGVRGDPKLLGHHSEGPAIEHHASERIRLVWSQLPHVGEHAVACKPIDRSRSRHFDGRSLELDVPP